MGYYDDEYQYEYEYEYTNRREFNHSLGWKGALGSLHAVFALSFSPKVIWQIFLDNLVLISGEVSVASSVYIHTSFILFGFGIKGDLTVSGRQHSVDGTFSVQIPFGQVSLVGEVVTPAQFLTDRRLTKAFAAKRLALAAKNEQRRVKRAKSAKKAGAKV